jgi:ribonuclease D
LQVEFRLFLGRGTAGGRAGQAVDILFIRPTGSAPHIQAYREFGRPRDETDARRRRDLANFLHEGDLPEGVFAGATAIAIDSETMGLRLGRDPLCVVQLSSGDGDAHVVRLDRSTYDAPNLKRLLTDPSVVKLFHFGRFDIAMFLLHLGVMTAPVYCTKIASKLARTYTDRHGLKDVTRELIGVELSKVQQSSDWGAAVLSPEQVAYAASDVLHLHALRERLNAMLVREGRMELAQAAFDYLPHRAALDLAGWEDIDIFAHS